MTPLPFDVCMRGWFQANYGDFPIEETPALDVFALCDAASQTAKQVLPSFLDALREINLGIALDPKLILLAAWLWDELLFLDLVIVRVCLPGDRESVSEDVGSIPFFWRKGPGLCVGAHTSLSRAIRQPLKQS